MGILLFFGMYWLLALNTLTPLRINLMAICGLILGAVFTVGLPGALFYEAWQRHISARADLYKGHVAAAEGLVALFIYKRGRYSGLEIKVVDETFKVDSDVFVAFKNGEPYTVYYAPHSRTLLSAERVESEVM